jgi:hypothetical protein
MMRGSVTLFLLGLLLQGIGAQAANLDKEACTRLEEEQVKFEKAGVRATIAKGAAWAKDNLSPDKLQEVRRLIEVDEQILFRCQGKPLVLLPSSVDADPVVTTDENAADGEKPADGKAPVAKAAAPKDAPAKDAKAAAPKAAAVKTDAAAGAKTDAAKKAAPVVPKAAAPTQPKPQSKDGAAKSEAAAVVAKPKPAPKKVDDAYKPPKPDAVQNPFANQTQ